MVVPSHPGTGCAIPVRIRDNPHITEDIQNITGVEHGLLEMQPYLPTCPLWDAWVTQWVSLSLGLLKGPESPNAFQGSGDSRPRPGVISCTPKRN
jgi:hypothetical protein